MELSLGPPKLPFGRNFFHLSLDLSDCVNDEERRGRPKFLPLQNEYRLVMRREGDALWYRH